MNNLAQTTYKNDNGNPVDAGTVEVLAAYKHIADGFYNWDCSKCGHGHSSRSCGWPIAGQVLACDKCKSMNLLVRTNCEETDKALRLLFQNEEREKELARLRGIEQLNKSELAGIQGTVYSFVHGALMVSIQKATDTAVVENSKIRAQLEDAMGKDACKNSGIFELICVLVSQRDNAYNEAEHYKKKAEGNI